MLNESFKAFVIYVSFFSLSLILIYLAKKIQIVFLLIKKDILSNKYSNFINISLKQKFLELIKIINLNQYAIKLEKNKQFFYVKMHG